MTHTVLVIGRARTGSTVLRQCLGSSASSFDLGEVFHADTHLETNFWRFWHKLSNSNIQFAHPHYLPDVWEKFITYFRRKTGAETLIVDTKVEYLPALRVPQAGRYWPIFPANSAGVGSKIIRVYRKNVLAQIVSFCLARRIGEWEAWNLNAPYELQKRNLKRFHFRENALRKMLKRKILKENRLAAQGLPTGKFPKGSRLRLDPDQLVLEIDRVSSEDNAVDTEMGSMIAYKVYYEDIFDNEGMVSSVLLEGLSKAIFDTAKI